MAKSSTNSGAALARGSSAIKRINQRLTDIAKQFGTQSEPYQKLANAIMNRGLEWQAKQKTINGRKTSVIVIRNIKTNQAQRNDLMILQNYQTAGQYKKAVKQILRDEGMRNITNAAIKEYDATIQAFNDILENDKNFVYEKERAGHIQVHHKGVRLSYEDIRQFVDDYNDLKKKEEQTIEGGEEE